MTPLHWGALGGLDEISLYLIENGADIEMVDNVSYLTLFWILSDRYFAIYQKGRTPLHLATYGEKDTLVDLLLRYNAWTEARDVVRI